MNEVEVSTQVFSIFDVDLTYSLVLFNEIMFVRERGAKKGAKLISTLHKIHLSKDEKLISKVKNRSLSGFKTVMEVLFCTL